MACNVHVSRANKPHGQYRRTTGLSNIMSTGEVPPSSRDSTFTRPFRIWSKAEHMSGLGAGKIADSHSGKFCDSSLTSQHPLMLYALFQLQVFFLESALATLLLLHHFLKDQPIAQIPLICFFWPAIRSLCEFIIQPNTAE
jgi:hypothetical protein